MLDDAGAVQFQQAIRTASTWDGKSDTRDGSGVALMRLVEVCAFFNANHDRPGTPRRRPHVELIVDADTLTGSVPVAWTSDHTHLAGVDHRDVVV